MRATHQQNKTSSHQSNLRYSLQPIAKFNKTNEAHAPVVPVRDTHITKQSMFRISIIRETQTLRTKTAVVSNYVTKSHHSVNDGDGEQESEAKNNNEDVAQNGLAYKDMSDVLYYSATIIYFLLQVAGSCFIPSVDIIFEFVGVICVNCMSFIFPSILYLTATKRYHANRVTILKSFNSMTEAALIKRNKCLEICAYVQLVLGIICFFAGMFNNIHGLVAK